MTDYIKREDALNTIRNTFTGMTADTLELRINDIPSADVAPVRHGRWKKDYLCSINGGTYSVIRCSECDFQFPMTVTNYCPNCGAKMDYDEWLASKDEREECNDD